MKKNELAERIAKRIAEELRSGDIVNLGIGIPTMVADYIPANKEVFIHTENGMLGVGPSPEEGQEDPNLVNAGKIFITESVGASYFHSADSFAMIRGGHIDVAVLGVLQVDQFGRIANWSVPGKTVLGVGGAMDLLTGAKRVIASTTHCTKDGEPKIVAECDYPLTSERKANIIVTEHAVFHIDSDGLILTEILSDLTVEEITNITGAPFKVKLQHIEIS